MMRAECSAGPAAELHDHNAPPQVGAFVQSQMPGSRLVTLKREPNTVTDVDPFNLLDHPMYVVTAEADGERAGCLVGYASQCSIQPARFMVWLS